MKIINLIHQSKVYTSNVYLITGTWNAIEDVNTLIDVGRDPAMIERLDSASTGVGKKRVEQVVLTHCHYDHASLLPTIQKLYNPTVYAASTSLEGVHQLLKGGERMRLGDRFFEVIAMPGHSNDSICLYCEEEKVLFAGDTPLIIRSKDTQYEEAFLNALAYLTTKDIECIYFGHGAPLVRDCREILKLSLKNAYCEK